MAIIKQDVPQPHGKFDKIEVSIETLTIEQMGKALEGKAELQRGIKSWHRAKLVDDASCGQFWFNGSSIVFDDNGKLIDGQHRLSALVSAGVTRPLLVVRGVSSKSYVVIDSGVGKSIGDFFKFKGIPNANASAAAARWILRYKNSNKGVIFHTSLVGRKDTMDTYLDYSDEIGDGLKRTRGISAFLGSASMGSALWVIISEAYGEELALAFFGSLEAGIGKPAITKLRKSIATDNNRARRQIPPDNRFCSVLEASLVYAKGTARKLIRPSVQKIPSL